MLLRKGSTIYSFHLLPFYGNITDSLLVCHCCNTTVLVFQIIYYTGKDVYPGQELMVYYGKEFARVLGIDTYRYMMDWDRLPKWDNYFKEQLRPSLKVQGSG